MNLINKAKSVWTKHKDSIIFGLCIVGGIVSGAILVKAIIEMPSGNYIQDIKSPIEPPVDPPVVDWYHYSRPDDKYEWDDDKYKDDWEKLSIAANYLDLEEGESYVISSKEGIADDDEAVDIGNVYMSHYIDDVVVNPPEEEEEEEECDEFMVKIPKDASDDVHRIVEEFVSFVENEDIEIKFL